MVTTRQQIRAQNALAKVDRRLVSVESLRRELGDVMPDPKWQWVYEKRCRVCSAGEDVVNMVNRMIVGGETYRGVLRALAAINTAREANRLKRITYNSVNGHAKKHIPYEAAAVRAILERRANQAEVDFVEGVQNLVTPAVLAEAIMTKSFQQLEGSHISPGQGLAAARFLHRLTEGEKAGADAAFALAQLDNLIEVVKRVVPEQYWGEIVAAMEGLQTKDKQTIDAEVVPDDDEDEDDEFNPVEDVDDRDTMT